MVGTSSVNRGGKGEAMGKEMSEVDELEQVAKAANDKWCGEFASGAQRKPVNGTQK